MGKKKKSEGGKAVEKKETSPRKGSGTTNTPAKDPKKMNLPERASYAIDRMEIMTRGIDYLKELKAESRERLKGNGGKAALAQFLCGLVMILLIGIQFMKNEELGGVPLWFPLVVAVMLNVIYQYMWVGLQRAYQEVAEGKPFKLGDLLRGSGSDGLGRLRLSMWFVVVQYCCAAPAVIFQLIYQLTGDMLFFWGMAVSAGFGIIAYYFVYLGISQAPYYMEEAEPGEEGKLMGKSWRIMKGRKVQLFALRFSCLEMHFANIFTFGLGTLWTLPYMGEIMAVYHTEIIKGHNFVDKSTKKC